MAPQDSQGSFAGHRVLLSYHRLVALAGAATGPSSDTDPQPQPTDRTELPDVAGAPVSADGSFSLSLPDLSEVRKPIEVAVLAPSGVTLGRKTLGLVELGTEFTVSAAAAQPFVIRPSEDPMLGQPKRLTGRVIDRAGRPAATGLPFVIYGLDDNAGAQARPLLSMATQMGGYFSGPWPAESLVAAYAEVGGARATITLVDGRLPQRAVLMVDLPSDDADCGCAPSPPRAPDQQDLVSNSEAYSQDLGGGCVNLTMPNRVIEEYAYFTVVRTTEPEVRPRATQPPVRLPNSLLLRLANLTLQEPVTDRAVRAIEPAIKAIDHDDFSELIEGAANGAGHPAAAQQLIFSLDARNAKQLLAEPSALTRESIFAAAVKSEAVDVHRLIDLLGSGVPARSELDGRHSIDWDATPTVFEATTVALGHVLHFRQVWRADGYSLGDLLYSLPLAPGQKRLISTIDWTRRTAGERLEVMESEEQMRALAERDRDISEIVGSHLDEQIDGGSSSSSSAGGGGIGAGFIGSGFGVLAGVAGGASSSSSSSWQDSSRTLAGNSLQQLRDRTTQRASAVRSVRSTVIETVAQSEAARTETEVVANYNHCHAITVEYFEVLRHFQVSEELAHVSECVFVPLPMSPFDGAKARRWRATLLAWLRRPELGTGFDAIERIATNWDGWDYPEHRFSEEAPEELDGELRVSFVIPRPHDDDDGKFQLDQWDWLTPYLWGAPSSIFNLMADQVNEQFRDINRQMTAEFNTQIQRARDEYFAREVAPRVAEQIVHAMRFAYVTRSGGQVQLPMDATLISKYAEGVPLYVSVRASDGLPALPREDIHKFRIQLDSGVGSQAPVVPAEARILVRSGKARYRTPHLTHLLFLDPRVDNDLSDGDDVLIATPTSFEERKDPRAEDRRAAEQLVKHLNEHLEFYHQAIWSSLDPQRRYLLLDGIIAPNSGGRSVASVVENRLLGIVGNCLVLPVTPGIHLDPTLAPDPATGQRVDLIHAYAVEPPPPTRISVPTRGVYAESVMGACNACEIKDDTRFWRWEESPLPDEPTPIEPISTESRQAAEANATPTPLPAPIVNIQNAPGLPDPLGLSQAMEILGRPDIFRDASGLAGTQRNALAAFQGVMDTAKAFGGMAAQLAQQQEMGRTVDRTLEQVKAAQAGGMLTQQQAQGLAHAALQSLAGDPGPDHQNPVHDPEVSNAIDKAADSPTGSVTVTSPEETVHAYFDDTETGGPAVGGAPPPVPLFSSTAAVTLTTNSKLQAALDAAVSALETKRTLTKGSLPVAVTVADISAGGTGPFPSAGWRATDVDYIASEAKVAAMYAAYALRDMVRRFAAASGATTAAALFTQLSASMNPSIQAAVPRIASAANLQDRHRIPDYAAVFTANQSGGHLQVDFNAKYLEALEDMIIPSSNAAAATCIHGIGYGYLNGCLADATLFDSATATGLWLAADFQLGKVFPSVRIPARNDGTSAQAGTTLHMVRLVASIATNTSPPAAPPAKGQPPLLDSASCTDMLARLHRAAVGVPNRGFDPPFAGRPGVLKAGSITHNKLGLGNLGPPDKPGPQVLSEVSVLTDPGKPGRRYVVAWHNLVDLTPISLADIATLIRDTINTFEA